MPISIIPVVRHTNLLPMDHTCHSILVYIDSSQTYQFHMFHCQLALSRAMNFGHPDPNFLPCKNLFLRRSGDLLVFKRAWPAAKNKKLQKKSEPSLNISDTILVIKSITHDCLTMLRANEAFLLIQQRGTRGSRGSALRCTSKAWYGDHQ